MGDGPLAMTRRTFLGYLSAVPLAARLGSSRHFAGEPPRVVVVGAGAFGGWTALHLHRMGARVTLLDAWGPGNPRSSSGGETRVIRSIYGKDRIYVEMVRRAYELWEELTGEIAEPLYVETGAMWMHRGSDAYVRSALPIVRELGFPVEEIEVELAGRQYPQIRFDGVRSVWMERRAGTLSARQACVAVRDLFERTGGTYRVGSVKPRAIEGDSISSVQLSDGSRLEADIFVFACGPWLGNLFPDLLGGAIRPTRQEVYYFGVPPGSTRYAPGNLPVWIDFGDRIIYGIPDVHGRGFKMADDTRGEPFDPTGGDRSPSADGIARAREFLAERFPELSSAPLVEARVCQYENSPDGHLIVDRHPGARNVWIVGGGSGHGFKLSPAVGEMAAERIASGTEVPELFRLERFEKEGEVRTQFESIDE